MRPGTGTDADDRGAAAAPGARRALQGVGITAGFLLLALLAPLSPPCAADDGSAYERATGAMRKGDFAEAFCLLKPLAKARDPRALYLLGWMYHNGYGLAIDDARAREMWSEAAAAGNLDAVFALGQLLELDGGSREERRRAVDYYLRAARAGHEDAPGRLRAHLLKNGMKSDPDLLDALVREWSLFGTTLTVTADKVNVRERPDTGSAVIVQIRQGNPLVELSRRGKWVYVAVGGHPVVGWVYGPLVN